MKILRFKQKDGTPLYGIKDKDKIIPIKGLPYVEHIEFLNEQTIPYASSILIAPCVPTKIIALAINFPGATGHTKDMSEPLVFLKASNCIASCNDKVRIAFSSETWGESELGVVIKKKAKNIKPINVKDYILGYIPVNDVSCENVDDRDHHLARSKSADGYLPIGPWIDTDYDYNNKVIEAYHNDSLIRQGMINDMFWKPEKILPWLSSWMTLYPGDIISTGAPLRTRDRLYLKDGDIFTVKIEGLPELSTFFYEKKI